MKGTVTEIWHVFDGQSKELVIPVYQRNYDWSQAQCERLFDDLVEIIEEDREKHFFGAVVGSPEDSFTWVVIDGQQRLTTISVLMLALIHAARAGEIDLAQSSLPDALEGNYLLRKDGSELDSKVKLKPVKDDAEAYRRLFHAEKDFMESSNVTANYRYFRRRLADTSLSADEVWLAIQRLEIMLLDLQKGDDPQRIFETLNSTGLALSEADKIRNFVLMGLKTKHQDRLYEYQWNPMEKNVEYRTDWFIRWFLVTKTSRTPRQDEVYEAFKAYVQRTDQTIDEVLEKMREYSTYARQITRHETGEPELDKVLARYRTLHSDVMLPFLLPVLRDHHEGIVPLRDMIRIIRILESYLFRRTVCGMWANALNKIFAHAYSELRRLRTGDQEYSEVLIYLLRRRDESSGRFPDDEEFREELQTRNFYRLRTENRTYLFECLENLDSKDTRDIATRLESGELSIEHIMPQQLTTAWREELGTEADTIHQTWLNRLGNLTVTAYNSAYSNSTFESKLHAANGLAESPYRLNAYVKEQRTWGAEQIAQRTQQLADAALSFWPYAETNFAPPAVVLPTEPMGWSRSFRGREIVAYEFGDTTQTVSAWSEALPGIVGSILRDHRAQLLASVRDNIMLSTDPVHIHGDERGWVRVDPSLAVFVASSTNQKLRGLRQLFDALQLNADDLVFTLRTARSSCDGAALIDESETASEQSPYSALIKFHPRFEELAGSASAPADTVSIRHEFRAAFSAHDAGDAMSSLQGRPFVEFTPEVITGSTHVQVLALIHITLEQEQYFNPAALHQSLLDGRAIAWLERLRSS
ncbi:DUF262 domain-containing protein [Brachybacterium paraconglomeratum]|uniref:DUF262 domain-containing protein n=1 Tax=Brachybacterium paraconglomeratum TaxID=173362 RepID=UPI00223B0525|nr:DUF262 domain-containing protein [Brachybacterium paraconglomeratum]MCT1435941.1 DUF262 domain-containing protein [Brachybacterium paraconglomeratum]